MEPTKKEPTDPDADLDRMIEAISREENTELDDDLRRLVFPSSQPDRISPRAGSEQPEECRLPPALRDPQVMPYTEEEARALNSDSLYLSDALEVMRRQMEECTSSPFPQPPSATSSSMFYNSPQMTSPGFSPSPYLAIQGSAAEASPESYMSPRPLPPLRPLPLPQTTCYANHGTPHHEIDCESVPSDSKENPMEQSVGTPRSGARRVKCCRGGIDFCAAIRELVRAKDPTQQHLVDVPSVSFERDTLHAHVKERGFRPKDATLEKELLPWEICPPMPLVNGSKKAPTMTDCDQWLRIGYFELGQKMGEEYYATPGVRAVNVTGYSFTDDKTSFAFGGISCSSRDRKTEAVRKEIGRAMRLELNEDNTVDLIVESEPPLFIQAPMHSLLKRQNDENLSLTTVFRLACPDKDNEPRMRVFDENIFNCLISHAYDMGYDQFYALDNMCRIRVSFIKGWGSHYARQSVTETPVWIEIQFTAMLQKIDIFLNSMGPNFNKASSVS